MSRDLSETEMIVIGTSAGGLDLLNLILPAIAKTQKLKVCVVIHLAPTGPNLIPELLDDRCSLLVKEAEPGEMLQEDVIYISPPDYHLCVEPNMILTLSSEEQVNYSRPSIDVLFESAAYAFGKKTLGILLTGANSDGAEGLRKIKDAGGITIVQEPGDAEYGVMPQSAISLMEPDYILEKEKIRDFLKELSERGSSDA